MKRVAILLCVILLLAMVGCKKKDKHETDPAGKDSIDIIDESSEPVKNEEDKPDDTYEDESMDVADGSDVFGGDDNNDQIIGGSNGESDTTGDSSEGTGDNGSAGNSGNTSNDGDAGNSKDENPDKSNDGWSKYY